MKLQQILTKAEPYVFEGEALDNAWILKNRQMIEQYAIDEMRNDGYVPILDSSSGLEISFDQEREIFKYNLKIYGYKLGAEANNYMGILQDECLLVANDMQAVSIIEL